MYISRIDIKNIRSIKNLSWTFPSNQRNGWHIAIGDNGAGKSTFLRSIALALVGPTEALALRQDWNSWLNNKEEKGTTWLNLIYDKKFDKISGKGKVVQKKNLTAGIRFLRDDIEVKIQPMRSTTSAARHVWGGKEGWFSVAYGPFRRFSGGDKDYEKLFYSNPKLAAHLSVFGENIALTECIRWLQDLQFQKLENRPHGNLLDNIFKFVNQEGFLPHNAQLKSISSKGVEFVDGNGCLLPVEDLSDGYRSILSMTFEIIRQLTRVYNSDNLFENGDYTKIVAPGVILIDEIDAHLHPTWQRKIGQWLCKHFPNLQFIVTTHSPLVCQAATTIWRLPRPGSNDKGEMIIGTELDRLRLGNVLDAYGTELFGDDITRSDESKKMLERLALLNSKERHGTLTEEEKSEQQNLRATLPSTAHIISKDDSAT
jgi:energy-coupling factor transporter ATP-binding protein EcfA2